MNLFLSVVFMDVDLIHLIIMIVGIVTIFATYFIENTIREYIYKKTILNKINFCVICDSLKRLKLFTRSISDQTILDSHNLMKRYTNANVDLKNVTACGVTAQAIFKILSGIQGINFENVQITTKIDDINELLDENIIWVSISSCECCTFPGHAFIIVCYHDHCVIIQSFINTYDHRKYIEKIPKHVIARYLENINNIFAQDNKKMNPQMIDDLGKMTHVDLARYSDCNLSESSFSIYYVKKKSSLKCNGIH